MLRLQSLQSGVWEEELRTALLTRSMMSQMICVTGAVRNGWIANRGVNIWPEDAVRYRWFAWKLWQVKRWPDVQAEAIAAPTLASITGFTLALLSIPCCLGP